MSNTRIKQKFPFSALTLLVGQQEQHPTCKKYGWELIALTIAINVLNFQKINFLIIRLKLIAHQLNHVSGTTNILPQQAHTASHPLLAMLAAKFLLSPATTVPCEQLFLVAGHILNKKRASLSSNNPEHISLPPQLVE